MSFVAALARTRLASSSSLALVRPARHALAGSRLAAPAAHQTRTYAKPAKKKGGKDKSADDDAPSSSSSGKRGSKGVATDELVPASQRVVSSAEYRATEAKMQAATEWFRKEAAALETRATGRVTPAVLAPVRVRAGEAAGNGMRLEEVATVGVREGTTLMVTVFEEHTLKAVEQAIYEAKLPGITPQRMDSRTIKIPIPKPTVETRNALYTTAARQSEDTRVQFRKLHQALLKKEDVKKHSPEFPVYQALYDKSIAELDKILARLKKSTG